MCHLDPQMMILDKTRVFDQKWLCFFKYSKISFNIFSITNVSKLFKIINNVIVIVKFSRIFEKLNVLFYGLSKFTGMFY